VATGLDEVSDGLQVLRSKTGTFINGKVTAVASTKLGVRGNIPRYIPWCNLSRFCKKRSVRWGRNLEMTGYKPTYPL